ncbi:nuclear transport factor 2 family protein [Streptomyces sp. NPDC052101]|uniref:nuclear transport factor 2 family protein n=1 Tax=Streptomyces sp. NPDC052101 TaxID=3155763 RepID=UPI003421AA26
MSVSTAHDVDESQALRDRNEIIRVCTLVAWLSDRRDWAALHDILADEVDFDYTSLNGGEPLVLPRQAVIAGWSAVLGGLQATQHLVSNQLVTVNGDTAQYTASVLATHVLPNDQGESTWTVGGHYLYTLARSEGEWRISGIKMTADWTAGNRDIMLLAIKDQPDSVKEWKHERR